MAVVFEKPKFLTDTPLHYCPGCTHGIAHRLVAEALEEIGAENVVGVAPVGCAVFAYNYFNCDMQQAAHGRAPSVAQGIKLVNPDNIVFAYQGDGDLASIGMAEIVHACARGANITIIFINNGIYGMTSGQMAPTTLEGMKTTTCPRGRDVKTMGYPLYLGPILAQLPGVAYVTRQAVDSVAHVRNLKKAMLKAFEYQKQKLGFCLIEVVSNCPSNLKMTAVQANEFVRNTMIPNYPLGDIKTPEGK